ncbi:MAG: hypothetical protein AB7U20_05800 [Planctomycetaceae bacterium]
MSDDGHHPPPIAIAAMLSVLIAAFGWAFAAAQFAHAEESWRQDVNSTRAGNPIAEVSRRHEGASIDEGNLFSSSGSGHGRLRREADRAFLDFVANALIHIPQAPAVLRFNLRHRRWLVAIFAVLELGAAAIALWMRSLERQWSLPRTARARREPARPSRRKSAID